MSGNLIDLTAVQRRLLSETDLNLRQKERAARTDYRDVGLVAKDLASKVRAGQLAQRTLTAMAHLGHEAARQITEIQTDPAKGLDALKFVELGWDQKTKFSCATQALFLLNSEVIQEIIVEEVTHAPSDEGDYDQAQGIAFALNDIMDELSETGIGEIAVMDLGGLILELPVRMVQSYRAVSDLRTIARALWGSGAAHPQSQLSASSLNLRNPVIQEAFEKQVDACVQDLIANTLSSI